MYTYQCLSVVCQIGCFFCILRTMQQLTTDSDKKPHGMSGLRKCVIFMVGAVDCMLFGGAIFGWPQLVYTLKLEHIFEDLCDETGATQHATSAPSFMPFIRNCTTYDPANSSQVMTPSCPQQDERLALIYTSAVVFYGIPGILVGFLLHYAGLLVTRLTGGMAIVASFICLAATTAESPNWLFPAMILLALGGNQTRMSVMQFGDLFPKYRSTAITFLTGIYATSATLFIVFQLFANLGIERAVVCYYIAAIATLTTLASFMMPFDHIPHDEHVPGATEAGAKGPPLLHSLISWSSFLHTYWIFITLFAVNIFQQSYNIWITASFCTEREVQLYSNLFSYVNLFSIFLSPMLGICTDYMIRKANHQKSDPVERKVNAVQASFAPILMTSVITVVMYSCLFFFGSTPVIISLMCLSVARCAVIAVSSVYLRNRFPANHFNRLMGFYCTIVSAFTFLQYYHFVWSVEAYHQAHLTMVALIVVSILNPLHILNTSYIQREVRVHFPPPSLQPIVCDPIRTTKPQAKNENMVLLNRPPTNPKYQ